MDGLEVSKAHLPHPRHPLVVASPYQTHPELPVVSYEWLCQAGDAAEALSPKAKPFWERMGALF